MYSVVLRNDDQRIVKVWYEALKELLNGEFFLWSQENVWCGLPGHPNPSRVGSLESW
jgi:hypothetical protein